MRALPNLRTSAIAIVTVLALLIVPACGSLCSAMNHCASNASSANSDSCHHAHMSTQSDSGTLSSLASCNQQPSILAILGASDSSTQPQTELAPGGTLSIDESGFALPLTNRSDKF